MSKYKNIGVVLFPINAALSFASMSALALIMPLQNFAPTAFAIAIGNYLSILVNFGQDQTQIISFLRLPNPRGRTKSFFRRQSISLFVLFLLIIVYYIFEHLQCNQPEDIFLGGLALAWAAMVGLFPNAYVDFLQRLTLQQSLIFGERALGLIHIYLFALYGDGQDFRLLLLGLVFLRLIFIFVQYALCIIYDNESLDVFKGMNKSVNDGIAQSLKVALTQMIPSAGMFGALYVFQMTAAAEDVAVVSFGIQCFAFAALIPAIYIRRNLRELASSDLKRSAQNNAFILMQARNLFPVALVAAVMTIAIIWIWLLVVLKNNVGYGHFMSALIIGIWSIVAAYGVRLSRALIHRGEIYFYSKWSLINSLIGLIAAIYLSKEMGALGFVGGIAIAHVFVIFRYHLFILYDLELVN